MSVLLARLSALEGDVCYRVPPLAGTGIYRYVSGRLPILLSAPHGAVHTRRGRIKEEDEYTAGLAQLVAELTGAAAIYARRRSDTDPNWYRQVPYKDRLARAVAEDGIGFVLDLHAAAPYRDFGIALGTVEGESCPQQRGQILHTLMAAGFTPDGRGLGRLDVDQTFTGRGLKGQETVTRFSWKQLHCPAAQLELHPCLRVVARRPDAWWPRPYFGDRRLIERTVYMLVELVHQCAAMLGQQD